MLIIFALAFIAYEIIRAHRVNRSQTPTNQPESEIQR